MGTAILVRAVIIVRIEQIDQRTAVTQSIVTPILKKAFEVMNAAVHIHIIAALVGLPRPNLSTCRPTASQNGHKYPSPADLQR